jgi:hypothetical protein
VIEGGGCVTSGRDALIEVGLIKRGAPWIRIRRGRRCWVS